MKKTEWIGASVPHLAIIDQDLWDKVQKRIAATPTKRPEMHRRPKRLLSGLLRCGICDENMTILNKNRYGCGTAKRKGTCSNLLTMAASEIEHLVLDGLQNRLLQSSMTKIFIKEYFSELGNIRTRYRHKVRSLAKEKGKLESQIKRLVEAIADGTLKNIGAVGQKLCELERKLATLPNLDKTEPREIDLKQQAIELYKNQIQNLAKTLNEEDTAREEGSNALRD